MKSSNWTLTYVAPSRRGGFDTVAEEYETEAGARSMIRHLDGVRDQYGRYIAEGFEVYGPGEELPDGLYYLA